MEIKIKKKKATHYSPPEFQLQLGE